MAVRAATVPLFLFVTVSAGLAQRDEAEREKQERVADILVALGARDGAKIADLGPADGFMPCASRAPSRRAVERTPWTSMPKHWNGYASALRRTPSPM